MRLTRLIASGCGTGYVPVAGGTLASAVTLLPGAALLHLSPALPLLAAIIATFAGLWSIHAERVEGDPGWVVIDEVAGQLLALCGLARVTPWGLFAAFMLFRLLDIAKPGAIGWADRQKGFVGVMADDVIAGTVAAAILWAVRARWPGLLD